MIAARICWWTIINALAPRLLTFTNWGIDFMVGGCLKYLLSASGIGFLYVRRDLIEQLIPRVTGWKGRTNPFEYRIDALDWPRSARPFETGALPIPSVFAASAALELLQAVGFEAIERQISMLASSFIPRVIDEGFAVATTRIDAARWSWCEARMRRSWCNAQSA